MQTFLTTLKKGVPRAIDRAQAFSRRYPWYLKLDIRKYFDSVDHGIALELLKRKILVITDLGDRQCVGWVERVSRWVSLASQPFRSPYLFV